ncbi:MAG: 7-carboxy-7-deazaguanine synthase [Pseudomonadota bacterium]
MPYAIKEIFYSLQGEGAHTGRPAVLCRFAGCNLWSGREEDRHRAVCWFCDTDFRGTDGPNGGVFSSAAALAKAIAASHCREQQEKPAMSVHPRTTGTRRSVGANPMVVCTGGEPLLQLDEALVVALHREGFVVALETNGTLPAPPGIDWVCVSPKMNTSLATRQGNELKLVYPQRGLDPEHYAGLRFEHFFIQPMMTGPDTATNTELALRYCLEHPQWRLGLQIHKLLGIR